MGSNPFATSSPPPVFGEQAPVAGPVGGAWGSSPIPLDEEDEPFTAAHLAAANEAAVPSVDGSGGGGGNGAAPHTALTFTGGSRLQSRYGAVLQKGSSAAEGV